MIFTVHRPPIPSSVLLHSGLTCANVLAKGQGFNVGGDQVDNHVGQILASLLPNWKLVTQAMEICFDIVGRLAARNGIFNLADQFFAEVTLARELGLGMWGSQGQPHQAKRDQAKSLHHIGSSSSKSEQ